MKDTPYKSFFLIEVGEPGYFHLINYEFLHEGAMDPRNYKAVSVSSFFFPDDLFHENIFL